MPGLLSSENGALALRNDFRQPASPTASNIHRGAWRVKEASKFPWARILPRRICATELDDVPRRRAAVLRLDSLHFGKCRQSWAADSSTRIRSEGCRDNLDLFRRNDFEQSLLNSYIRQNGFLGESCWYCRADRTLRSSRGSFTSVPDANVQCGNHVLRSMSAI